MVSLHLSAIVNMFKISKNCVESRYIISHKCGLNFWVFFGGGGDFTVTALFVSSYLLCLWHEKKVVLRLNPHMKIMQIRKLPCAHKEIKYYFS